MIGSSRNIWDFEPRSVPGCTMWLDGADPSGTGVPPSAGTLATWIDKSGNGRNGVQYSSLSRPQFVTNSLNSKGGVSFTAASSNCYQTQVVLPTPGTIFVVGFSSNDGFILSGIPTPNSGHPPYYATFARDVEFGINNTSDTAHSGNVGSTSNVNYILTGLYTGSNVSAIMNSGTLSNTVAFSGTPKTPVTTLIGINSYAGSLNAPLGGTINEFITYSVALTTTQQQQVEGYLAWKWGLNPPTTKGFIPTSISGCELWFDGGDYTTMFQNIEGTSNVSNSNQSVARWTDKIRSLSISNTGVPGQSMQAPTSISGGGIFFSNTSTVVGSSAQGLGTSLTGATNQTAYLFRMPTRHMTLITASYPLSNNSLRQICCMASSPNGAGNVPNFNIGHEIGAGNGGTILFDWDGANWGQIAQSTSGYNSNAVLRIDSLTATTTPLWSTNGNSNTFTQTSNYTSALTNYPVNNFAIGGYSSTFVGSRNFHGNVYEILLYSKALTTDERKKVESYLSKKWSIALSNTISFSNPFYSIQPFSRRFNPIDIPGCQLWFDAADRSTITLNGTNVSSWRDKSGNGYSVSQSTSGNQPTYTLNLLNGLPGIQLSSQKFLEQFGSNMPNFTSSTSSTVFIVAKNGGTLTGSGWNMVNTTWFNSSGTGINRYHFSFANSTTNGVTLYANGSLVGVTTAVSLGSNAIIGFTVSSTGNSINVNGTLTTYSGSTLPSTNNSTFFRFGDDRANFSTDVNVYEFIGFDTALTSSQRQQVEGYLAYKWDLISSLPSTHPFKKLTPSSALSFSPTAISGCSLWLDPADTSTVTLNGTSVIQVADKSRLGYNMSQATSGNRPTYSTSPNGNRMLTFTQSSSTRLSNTSFPSFIGSGPASYFLVEYNMTAPSGNPSPFGYSAGPNFGLIMQYNPGFTGGLQPFSTGVSSFTSATPRLIFLYKQNVASSNMIGFINGTSQTVSDTTSGTYSGTFSVGSGPNGFISGNICELIVFNRAVTTPERQQVEGYLADKWGVKSSLPSIHPYRSFGPSFVGITAPDSGYSNFLWTRFYNITSDPSINGPGSSGWGSLIGTAGAYNPINYQDGDSRIGQSDFVGVISKGFMYSATATVVTFRTISDDGIVVIFNGSNVIQNWTYHGDTTDTSASVTLPAGYTPIELRFFEWGGGFTCELYWSVGSTGTYVSDGTARMFHNNTSKS
jgi:hypothetical protein